MESLDLAGKELQTVPRSIQSMSSIKKLKLGDNPFHCNCDMTWMIGWLNINSTKDIVDDYTDIICDNGKFKGMPIYLLNLVDMGCFPSKWTNLQKIGVGICAGISLLIIVSLAVLVLKKSREIRFFLYYYCKWCICVGLPRDDKNEKLDKVEYDAYLSYRYFKFCYEKRYHLIILFLLVSIIVVNFKRFITQTSMIVFLSGSNKRHQVGE